MERHMKMEECNNCGHSATVTRGDYRFEEIGLPFVLGNIEVIKCEECDTTEPVIPNMNELMHTLALAVICQPCKLRAEEVRFLRTYVGKSSKDFAALLHLDKTSMSKMENGERRVGKQTDKLIRLLIVNLSPELKDKVKQLIEMMPDIDDAPCDDPSDIRVDPATMRYQYA
jgi:DNA-binding transcriptional regulator YiaG